MVSISQWDNQGPERLSDWLISHSSSKPRHPPHLSTGGVCVPSGAQSLLSSYVPHEEVGLLQNNLLHVATDGGTCRDHLILQAGEGGEGTKCSAQSSPSSGPPPEVRLNLT